MTKMVFAGVIEGAASKEEIEADKYNLQIWERGVVTACLQHTKGNKRRAARLLGIARSTLLNKIRLYEIDLAEIR